MGIIRVAKRSGYFVASNEPFNDESLSWEARGLMGYLLSKPDNWQVSTEDLIRRGPAGQYKIRKMLSELEDAGYLKREKLKDDAGQFYWISTVFETKQKDATSPMTRLSSAGEPVDIINTELNNNITAEEKENSSAVTPDIPKQSHRDSRLDHPAIKAYRSEARLHVPIVWRNEVIAAVGDAQERVTQWRTLVHDWIGHGWNKSNIKGMIDCFLSGGLSDDKGGYAHKKPEEVFWETHW